MYVHYSNCRNEFLVIINGYVEFNPTVRRLSVAEYPGLDTGDEENRTELETKAPTMSFEDFDEHEVSSVIY